MADFNFDRVVTSAVTRHVDGAFASAPANYTVELSGVGSTHTGLTVRLVDMAWSGSSDGITVASPVTVAGNIDVLDVADVVVVLGGLDRPAAIGFVAGLFGFDPENPPETVPFRAELGVAAMP